MSSAPSLSLYLFDLRAHPAGGHDLAASSQVPRGPDPVPHPRLGLGVHNLKHQNKCYISAVPILYIVGFI